MSIATTERCRFKACSARLLWATSAATGRAIPLDADPVEPGTRGALVLIGSVAFSRVPAAMRLAEMFGVDEATGDTRALEEYAWHLAHFATCPYADQARKSRKGRT